MAFPCDHQTHGPYYNLNDIVNASNVNTSPTLSLRTYKTFPYHVRSDPGLQWQNITGCIFEKQDHGYCCLKIRYHLTNDKCRLVSPSFCFRIIDPSRKKENTISIYEENFLIDVVDKKLYFVHFPYSNYNHYVVHKAMVEINTKIDGISQVCQNSHTAQVYLGRLSLAEKRGDSELIIWFLSPFDGSIFQIFNRNFFCSLETPTAHFTISWMKLDDTVQIEAPHGINYDGKVKVIAQYNVELDGLSNPDSCITFSENGRKLLLRFRFPHAASVISDHSQLDNLPMELGPKVKEFLDNPDLCRPLVSETNRPPVYLLFGIDYHSKRMDLLTQFRPTSYENHCDLLISSRLLATFGNYIELPKSIAMNFVSQRTNMIGQFLKYTFFSAVHKNKMAIFAVKSLPKTLQNGHLSLTPKKLWFPLEDKKFKEAFQKLSNLIKWDMLTKKENDLLVTGHEFILDLPLATVRVKLGAEYKDYRKCAGCGKAEENKRRSKNGKRMSQFKVCGWCKDHGFHKMWWERPCHYCSEKCADDHWPIHQLEHDNQKVKSGKGKGKKKKVKK